MQPLSVQIFYVVAADMQKIQAALARSIEQLPPTSPLNPSDCQLVSDLAGALRQELIKFDCKAALATINKIQGSIDNSALTYGSLRALIEELDGRIRDELGTSVAFTLTAQEALLFNATDGVITDDFRAKFEDSLYDVEECAKCMALGRGTAAVFHAMRVLERGIAAIAACLGIPDPVKPAEKNWGLMLGKIDEAIKAKWPTAADREHGDGHLFESFHATLSAIRNPWRNKSMHPAKKYTEQEAARIVGAVGSFMTELVERCDEKGEPKA